MAEDLSRLVEWLQQNVLIPPVDAAHRKRRAFLVSPTRAAEAIELSEPLDLAVYEFGRGQKNSRVRQTLLAPLLDALREAVEGDGTGEVLLEGFHDVIETVARIQARADMQQRAEERIGNRSDILGAVIEDFGDELIVKSDKNGSIRIRGASNIPMFMAFWRAHGHRLSREAFLDLDPNVNEKNLERHRVRLCGRLQDILLEIVQSGNGYQMRRCS